MTNRRLYAGDDPSTETTLARDSVAMRLVTELVERGVKTFFGVPGGAACPVFEAIRVVRGARLVESRQETQAAFAAALFQRQTGITPVVVVTAGPGVTNVVTGVASASLDRIPMLVIAGDASWQKTGGLMAQASGPEGVDAESILRSVTRAQVRAGNARGATSQALSALAAAENPENPGPALFVLPIDRAMEPCEDVLVLREEAPARTPVPAFALNETLELLLGAKRPLVVLGTGCRGREREVAAMLDLLGIPFMTTPGAKGVVDERHRLSLRNGGMAASMWARRYTRKGIDVCLTLGTDLDDTSIAGTPPIGPGGKLIHVDRNPNVFGRNVPTQLGIPCDIGAFCVALTGAMVDGGWEVTPDIRRAVRSAHQGSPYDLPGFRRDGAKQIRTHRLLADLEDAVPEDSRFVTDIGEHMLFALHYLTATAPDRFTIQLNLGSMASGIAGAIGLSLADTKKLVVCVCGDGGMQMSGMEALVAMKERLPILFVVVNDGRYNMVHHGMRQIFGQAEDYAMPMVAWDAWASSFGMPATVVRGPGQVTRKLVADLMKNGGPALIDARIDPSVRIRGGGRVEALQQMSMSAANKGDRS